MNNKSFSAGFAAVDSTVKTIKQLPSGFCRVGKKVKDDVVHVTSTMAVGARYFGQEVVKKNVVNTGSAVAGFFAGMKHAAKIHTGKCKLIERGEGG